MRSRPWVLMACVMLMLVPTVVIAPGAGAIPASGCNRPIVVSRLAFGPGTVRPGQQSTARLAGRNCTKHVQTVTIQWEGQFAGGSRSACPVIDPLVQPVSVPARSALVAHVTYLVPKGCGAKALTVTTRMTNSAGKRISTKTASLRIAQK